LTHYIGGIAAGIQAGIGNVAAGSLFAGAQAVAAGAGLPVIGNVIAGGIVAGGAAVVNAVSHFRISLLDGRVYWKFSRFGARPLILDLGVAFRVCVVQKAW
jgi:3-oxoacyl-ACP reductase-like protein